MYHRILDFKGTMWYTIQIKSRFPTCPAGHHKPITSDVIEFTPKETPMNTPITPITRRALSNMMRNTAHYIWIGECGYDTRPYRAKPDTSGRLATDRDHAPVRVLEDWATRVFRATETPPGDCLRWLDECPRGTLVRYPDYSGCHHRGDTHYFKGGDGRWYDLGYWDWELNQYAASRE